ncbi:MAG: endonuclease/exonuclease/phosphatase family protein, partial [Ardenticatenaceae bacterium]
MDVTVGTFNINNLFSRYNFEAELDVFEEGGLTLDAEVTITLAEPVSYVLRTYEGRIIKPKPEEERKMIADRIKAMNVDVLAVQEVEDIGVLREFVLYDLMGLYPYQVLVEGNDPRFIDIGLLSKYPIGAVTSWQFATHRAEPSRFVFSRDLL